VTLIANGHPVSHPVFAEHGLSLPVEIVKRDGRTVPFNLDRIERAVRLCYDSEGVTALTPPGTIIARDRIVIPAEVQDAFAESAKYFPTPSQQFIFFDKYSRYNWELGRRETWVETVDRVVEYLKKLSRYSLDPEVYDRIHGAILRMEVMPSMRLLSQAACRSTTARSCR
jgi:hypothetical protein